MAVKIRLKRMGAKKRPFYRIVVADSRRARDGRFIEEIGYYNPLTQPKEVRIDQAKALDWIAKGAKPTDTVHRLFQANSVYQEPASPEPTETTEETASPEPAGATEE